MPLGKIEGGTEMSKNITPTKVRLIESVIKKTNSTDVDVVTQAMCLELEDLYGDNMEQQLGRLDMKTTADVFETVKQYLFKRKYIKDV